MTLPIPILSTVVNKVIGPVVLGIIGKKKDNRTSMTDAGVVTAVVGAVAAGVQGNSPTAVFDSLILIVENFKEMWPHYTMVFGVVWAALGVFRRAGKHEEQKVPGGA